MTRFVIRTLQFNESTFIYISSLLVYSFPLNDIFLTYCKGFNAFDNYLKAQYELLTFTWSTWEGAHSR